MGALDSVGHVSLRGVYVYKDGTYDVLLEIWVDEAARCGLYITHWSDCYSSAHRKHCVDANLTCRCLLHATQRVFVRALHLPNVRSGVLSPCTLPNTGSVLVTMETVDPPIISIYNSGCRKETFSRRETASEYCPSSLTV
jgi:hypothetical protein